MKDLSFPNQGLNLCPLQWKLGDLATGLPWKSQNSPLFKFFFFLILTWGKVVSLSSFTFSTLNQIRFTFFAPLFPNWLLSKCQGTTLMIAISSYSLQLSEVGNDHKALNAPWHTTLTNWRMKNIDEKHLWKNLNRYRIIFWQNSTPIYN